MPEFRRYNPSWSKWHRHQDTGSGPVARDNQHPLKLTATHRLRSEEYRIARGQQERSAARTRWRQDGVGGIDSTSGLWSNGMGSSSFTAAHPNTPPTFTELSRTDETVPINRKNPSIYRSMFNLYTSTSDLSTPGSNLSRHGPNSQLRSIQ